MFVCCMNCMIYLKRNPMRPVYLAVSASHLTDGETESTEGNRHAKLWSGSRAQHFIPLFCVELNHIE